MKKEQHVLAFLHDEMQLLAMRLCLCAFLHDKRKTSILQNYFIVHWQRTCSCPFFHDRMKASMCQISFMVQCCFWQCTCACARGKASRCYFPSKCNVLFGNHTCSCAFFHDKRKASMRQISFIVQCCFWQCTCACVIGKSKRC